MKISAIICEFNPIHSGHKRLIDYAKTISDKVVCIMSGNFVQRGMPACADKYDRARHAILCGADMVVELPVIFATASATDFAFGGVKIASQLHADYLVFGSECGDINQLQHVAKKLDDEDVNKNIAYYVSQGNSYPKAVSLALDTPLLDAPNNTLAIEYLRAINLIDRSITPVTIKRENNYNGEGIEFASSSALRKDKSLREQFTFDFVMDDIDDTIEQKYRNFACHFLSLKTADQLQQISGIAEGLQNKIVKAEKHSGYEVMMNQIKSKRYTRAKLQRIVLNCILNVTNDTLTDCKQNTLPTKVLAVKQDATALLQLCNDISSDEITTTADNLYLSFSGKKPPIKLQKI